MLNTGHLDTLTHLADHCQWRLVLIGDTHQLQAVGRGGMFAELCATGRVVELDTIHRFRNHWEADASLGLRHGDPAALATPISTSTGSVPHPSTSTSTPSPPPGSPPTTAVNGWRSPPPPTNTSTRSTDTIHEYRDWLGELGPDTRRRATAASFRVGDVDRHPSQRTTPAHHHRRLGPQPRLLDHQHHHPDRRSDRDPHRRTRHRHPAQRLRRRTRPTRLRGDRTRQPIRHRRPIHHPRHRCDHLPAACMSVPPADATRT